MMKAHPHINNRNPGQICREEVFYDHTARALIAMNAVKAISFVEFSREFS